MFRRWMVAPMMLTGALALFSAMWAGAVRIGWQWPVGVSAWPAIHGGLMVSGFLGTLVSLERAVGLGRRWALMAPALTALGTLWLITGAGGAVAPLLILLGSVALAAVFAHIVRLQPALFTAVMMAGVLSWAVGNGLWVADWPIYQIVPWWIGFLTLTIVGERLEFSRVLAPPPAAGILLVAAAGLLIVATVVSTIDLTAGERVLGLSLSGMALWLFRFDIARRTVRGEQQTRYIAICLLSGYVWLAVGGVFFLIYGGSTAGPNYDAALHAVLLGFVFAMIFGHALIIFPALLKLRLPYRPLFYLPLALLHLSLAIRVGGDLLTALEVRRWGGLLNAVTIVVFVALLLRTAILGRRASAS